MNITNEAVNFIKRWEGFSATAYYDVSRWSVGYGTIGVEGEKIDTTEAEKRLRDALKKYAKQLSKRITVEVTPNQTVGLLSAAYNLGVGSLEFEIIPMCNAGQFHEASEALRGYDHAGGKKLSGLTKRRDAEARLLESYTMTHGAPRVQYERNYWLLPPDATVAEFVQTATEAFEARATIGFSADDAGMGDLEDKTVVLIKPNRQPAGIREWFSAHYSGVKVITLPDGGPVAPQPPVAQTSALWGLHGSADGSWGNPILPPVVDFITKGNIEAYKALSNESPETLSLLQQIKPDMFFCVRLMGKVDADKSTASQFLEQCGHDTRRWYDAGCRYFEIHNEPNLTTEGWRTAWQNGEQFASWWLTVREALKADMPDALWGWPGLSPGADIEKLRTSALRFMEEAQEAINVADWLGVHCYWQTEDMLTSDDGGQFYQRIPYKHVPMLITEFSNPAADVPKTVKADQYNRYLKTLQSGNIKAAFCFISTASSGFEHETWNTDMARIVGARQ